MCCVSGNTLLLTLDFHRITAAWCKKHDVPIEKIFSKTLLTKCTSGLVYIGVDFVPLTFPPACSPMGYGGGWRLEVLMERDATWTCIRLMDVRTHPASLFTTPLPFYPHLIHVILVLIASPGRPAHCISVCIRYRVSRSLSPVGWTTSNIILTYIRCTYAFLRLGSGCGQEEVAMNFWHDLPLTRTRRRRRGGCADAAHFTWSQRNA